MDPYGNEIGQTSLTPHLKKARLSPAPLQQVEAGSSHLSISCGAAFVPEALQAKLIQSASALPPIPPVMLDSLFPPWGCSAFAAENLALGLRSELLEDLHRILTEPDPTSTNWQQLTNENNNPTNLFGQLPDLYPYFELHPSMCLPVLNTPLPSQTAPDGTTRPPGSRDLPRSPATDLPSGSGPPWHED